MVQDIVRVTPSQGPGAIQWKLCYNSNCGGPGDNPPTKYPVIMVPADKQEHGFVVVINDKHNTGITFASDATNPFDPAKALAVEPGQGHHPTSGINSNNQFKDVTLASPTALVLTDKNDNPSEMWLSYTLNFVDKNGAPVQSIDPDWHNGGGGSGTSSNTLLAIDLAITGATLLTLLVVALRQESIRQMVAGIVNWTRSK
jgi:hypothetical protein